MQRFFLVRILFALFFLILAAPVGAQRARIGGRSHRRIVNNDVITLYEFNERLRVVQRQPGQGIKSPPREILEKQLLERVINEKVQLQFATEPASG